MPVRSLQLWMEQAAIINGPLFRSINRHGRLQSAALSGGDVARVVKKLAERAGLDAAKYAGHSLRASHATSAAIAGASERSIMNQTGHRSVQMVRRYIREGEFVPGEQRGEVGVVGEPCRSQKCLGLTRVCYSKNCTYMAII
jgi:integrase